MTCRVSVVVPAYNSVAFIEATMQSILSQTFTDFELLVSDHSSTDGTWKALQRFAADPRVRLFRLPPGGGAPANWNAVTGMATGEFVKLVCGDDLLYPENLSAQVAALAAHPSAVLAASSRDVVDANGATVLSSRGLFGLQGEVSGAEAIRRTVLAGSNIFGEPASVMFRRDALSAAGGWDDRFPYVIDQATYCAVLQRGTFVAVPGPLAAFRLSHAQWSVQLMRAQREQAIALHHKCAVANPGLLGRDDLLVGNARVFASAFGRRAVYRWLGSRMIPSVAADNGSGGGEGADCDSAEQVIPRTSSRRRTLAMPRGRRREL